MNKAKYHEYLCSREWSLLKEKVRKRCKGKCERCREGKYEATHHLTYERIGYEKLSDLLGVCSACHEFLSGKSNDDPIAQILVFRAQDALKKSKELSGAMIDLYESMSDAGFENSDPPTPAGTLWSATNKLSEPLCIFGESLRWILSADPDEDE
jgi:hypothetical protein